MIDQAGWGSNRIYPDGYLRGSFDPRYVIVHWGGLTSERSTLEEAMSTLRAWQRFHQGKGWQDIAYNYAVDDIDRGDGYANLYRLRGENHGGHTSGTDPVTGLHWSTAGVGVVWIGGKRDLSGPSNAAKATMQRFVDARGLPVIGHQDTGKATQCPGPDWLEWSADYTPGGTPPVMPPTGEEPVISKNHPVEEVVERIQESLIVWDPDALPRFGVDGDYGSETAEWVAKFQTAAAIPVTGTVDGLTMALLD